MRESAGAWVGLVLTGVLLAGCTDSGARTGSVATALVARQPCEQPASSAPSVALDAVEPVSLISCEIRAIDLADEASGSIVGLPPTYQLASLTRAERESLIRILESEPQERPAACTAQATWTAPIYLRLSDGRLVQPALPVDSCGRTSAEVGEFVASLVFTDLQFAAPWQ